MSDKNTRYETPKVQRNITPKNLLDALLGSVQNSSPSETESNLPPTNPVSNRQPTETVAQQKAAQAKLLEKQKMEQKLERLLDRRDLLKMKLASSNRRDAGSASEQHSLAEFTAGKHTEMLRRQREDPFGALRYRFS